MHCILCIVTLKLITGGHTDRPTKQQTLSGIEVLLQLKTNKKDERHNVDISTYPYLTPPFTAGASNESNKKKIISKLQNIF